MIDPKLVRNNLPGPGIQYIGGWFQARRRTSASRWRNVDVPCRYWNLQILTRYLESGDTRHYKVGTQQRSRS